MSRSPFPQASWMKRRACRDRDPSPWFSTKGAEQSEAIVICATCPVHRACLAWALEEESELRQVGPGIFGGHTPAERREMLGLKPLERAPRVKHRPGMTATRRLEMIDATYGTATTDGPGFS